ncbi:hypothetical protein B0H10DRAFT_1989764 [Mycena sp. CBHHK59/15]|nr:hypothetical protein B0H10DRAFT_1989764 [Mycena sp. CBHHK59/15]
MLPYTVRYSRRTSSSLSVASPGPSLQAAWDPTASRPISSNSSSQGTGSFSASSSGWPPNPTPRQNTGSTMGYGGVQEESTSTRQWTFMGFEWTVRDVHKLRDFVEGIEPEITEDEQGGAAVLEDFEILKESPMIGDDKFKLEIARTPPIEGADNKSPTLSLYITSLILDFAHNYEMSASMMTAIKCQDDRTGERGARVEWVWEFWQNDWVFRRESEVWVCALPPLSALLENSRIRETDSLTICVQIHCPIGPFFPQQPAVYYVPRDLLDGLESSLDNPNTGDVRFVCLERMHPDKETSPATPVSETAPSSGRRPSSSTSSQSPFSAQTTARKRVIYAHSDILTRRSEYFATMLSSSFAETKLIPERGNSTLLSWRKLILRRYTGSSKQDDPRMAVEGIGAGWSARWLSVRGGEWDWKTFTKTPSDDSTVADARSATSAESNAQEANTSTSGKSKVFEANTTSSASPIRSSQPTPRASSKVTSNTASSSRQTPSTTRRPVQAPNSGSSAMELSSAGGISRTKPVPVSVGSATYSTSGHHPTSPRTQRPHQSAMISTPDPHPHPTPAPAPASALSVYQVAHRYAMPALASLALEHMMSTITPQSSFGLLLATSVWDELRTLVEDYVVEKWDEVSVSEEFEQCCQEVSAGEWGTEGGKTLMGLFRRLRSPSAMGYART